jgi:uncharacterized protein (TIGR01244 family)
MIAITPLTPDAAVSAALTEADFAEAAARGFETVLNVRPDGEAADQLTTALAKRAATAAGLEYVHIPTHKYELFADDIVSGVAHVLASAQGPVLVYCASGQRAAIVWAAAAARTVAVNDVLATLTAAGFDFDFLRDDLEAQADRARWTTAKPDKTTAAPTPAPAPSSARAAA